MAFCVSDETSEEDPAKARWNDLSVTAVDVEATARSAYTKDYFGESFVDSDFEPGPEVLNHVDLFCSYFQLLFSVLKSVGAQHGDCVWVRAADLQGPDRTPKLFDKVAPPS